MSDNTKVNNSHFGENSPATPAPKGLKNADDVFDTLITASPIRCGDNFADIVLSAVKKPSQEDELADSLLKSQPIRLGRSFDNRCLTLCLNAGKPFLTRIFFGRSMRTDCCYIFHRHFEGKEPCLH